MSLALLALVVLAAFSIEAIVGFGSTVLAVTIGAHFLPLDALLPAFVPLNLVLSAAIVARNARSIDRRLLVRRVLPFVGAGLAVGLALFRLRDVRALELVLAAFVVGLASLELARLARPEGVAARPLAPGAAAALLGVGGVVHGLFGSGGPMVVYVASRELEGKARFRATLSALWLVLNAALVVNYASLGLLSRASLGRSLALAPGLLLAFPLGDWLHRRVPEQRFRPIVYFVLLLAGLALGARRLFG
jgi:hypothetical protein